MAYVEKRPRTEMLVSGPEIVVQIEREQEQPNEILPTEVVAPIPPYDFFDSDIEVTPDDGSAPISVTLPLLEEPLTDPTDVYVSSSDFAGLEQEIQKGTP